MNKAFSHSPWSFHSKDDLGWQTALLTPVLGALQTAMLNDNVGDCRALDLKGLEWFKKEMKIPRSLSPKQPLMLDGNVVYLYLPSSGVSGMMLEYGINRKQAEQWWNMH